MMFDDERAACRGADVNLFYGIDGEPPGRRRRRETIAKALCAACPIQAACLTQGADEKYGIWGGQTAKERQHANTSTPTIARNIPTQKKCGGCGNTKPATEFYACKNATDGLSSKCKTCRRTDSRRVAEARRRNERLARLEDFTELTQIHHVHPNEAARRVGVTMKAIRRYKIEFAEQVAA